MGAGGGLPSEGLALPLSQVEGPPDESADAILSSDRLVAMVSWSGPRASLAPHLCRVRGDFTLRLSPVAAVGALSPSLPCSLRISVKSVTADPGASTPCASPGLG